MVVLHFRVPWICPLKMFAKLKHNHQTIPVTSFDLLLPNGHNLLCRAGMIFLDDVEPSAFFARNLRARKSSIPGIYYLNIMVYTWYTPGIYLVYHIMVTERWYILFEPQPHGIADEPPPPGGYVPRPEQVEQGTQPGCRNCNSKRTPRLLQDKSPCQDRLEIVQPPTMKRPGDHALF